MRYFNYTGLIVLALLLLNSCSKKIEVEKLNFDVSTSATSYNVGDTVHFNFVGNPDIIAFYSGEAGNNYEFRDRTLADGKPEMEFTSFRQWGAQENTLHLMISKDFSGGYSVDDVNNATWTEITEEANLSTGSDNTPSGTIDLSPYVEPGDDFYFAFRFTGETGSTQRTWTVRDFKIDLLLEDNSKSLVADIQNAEWIPVKLSGEESWVVNDNNITVKGGTGDWPSNDNWVITKALNPNKVSPDQSVGIKDISELLPQYDYVYTEPGDYEAVFVAKNATTKGIRTVVQKMNLTIH